MKKIVSILALIVAAILPLRAQNVYPQSAVNPVLTDILNSYTPWKSAEFEGKIKYDRLPVSPTIKMYMVNDKLIQISIRAVFVGEVARIDISPSEVLVVNKLKKTYCRESAAQLFELYPSLLSDMQSLFLARIAVPGHGELDHENFAVMNVTDAGNGDWLVIPSEEATGKFKYGYLVGANSRTKAFLAEIGERFSAQIEYSYPGKGMQMDVTLESSKKTDKITFEFNSVKWGGKQMDVPNLSNYRQLDIESFVKSFF